MSEHFLQLRVIYDDPPDLVEIEAYVVHDHWSALSSAYASPSFFDDGGEKLLRWANSPQKLLRIEAGADTGVGLIALEFYVIDSVGHARCAISLAAKNVGYERPAQISRFAIELPTELGLVERFAQEWIGLGRDFKREARLIGLPD